MSTTTTTIDQFIGYFLLVSLIIVTSVVLAHGIDQLTDQNNAIVAKLNTIDQQMTVLMQKASLPNTTLLHERLRQERNVRAAPRFLLLDSQALFLSLTMAIEDSHNRQYKDDNGHATDKDGTIVYDSACTECIRYAKLNASGTLLPPLHLF